MVIKYNLVDSNNYIYLISMKTTTKEYSSKVEPFGMVRHGGGLCPAVDFCGLLE